MKQIKIQEKFWKEIVSGKKKYYIAPLSEGLTSDTYEFVSVDYEVKKVKKTFCDGEVFRYSLKIKGKTFGTAKLTFIAGNPQITFIKNIYGFYAIDYKTKIKNDERLDMIKFYKLDKDTYDFVKENYIDKGVEFIVCEISEIKNKGENWWPKKN